MSKFIVIVNLLYFATFLCRLRPSMSFPVVWRSCRKLFLYLNSKDFEFSTSIGKGSHLDFQGDSRGCITFASSLLVEGTLIGNVHCSSTPRNPTKDSQSWVDDTMIFVEQDGFLQANVTYAVHTVIVYGTLIGDVSCKKLILGPSGKIIGNIQCVSLQVDDGAIIIGLVHCNKIGTKQIAFEQVADKSSTHESITSNSNNIPITLSGKDRNFHSTRNEDAAFNEQGLNKLNGITSLKHSQSSSTAKNYNGQSWKDSSPTLSDNFGNPLFSGANHQQIASFRHYRELSKETRNLLDLHRKNRRPSADEEVAIEVQDEKLLLQRSYVATDSALGEQDENDSDDILPAFLR